MIGRVPALLVLAIASLWPITAFGQLNVLRSGGFAGPYGEVLPSFERESGLTVTTTGGASQGRGPNTIPGLLERGVPADVVIMSREGLRDLVAVGRVNEGTVVDLARTPLGVAVRAGAPTPDISTVEGFVELVRGARSVNLVSTTGLYLMEQVFPALGIAEEVGRKTSGVASAALGGSDVDLVLRPVSELVRLPGFDFVGPAPKAIQFDSVFSAGVVTGAEHPEAARRLIVFLLSEDVQAAAKRHGMEPLSNDATTDPNSER